MKGHEGTLCSRGNLGLDYSGSYMIISICQNYQNCAPKKKKDEFCSKL